ncbi:Leucine-rich_repeat domain superfamily [Hexamita inflata]|uniref:Leucine-rich repeat domain superfamily n=1 Tax=Hexamita inflata TaxID=28002 RepID=A0AA86RGG4_9EUKA|nr:Leucine-rich repeat domain superfamily [Hexamita inflata]
MNQNPPSYSINYRFKAITQENVNNIIYDLQNQQSVELDLWHAQLRDTYLQQMFPFLMPVTSLDIGDNILSSGTIFQFLNLLSNTINAPRNLRYLCLNKLQLDVQSCQVLSNAFKAGFSPIEELYLKDCQISDQGFAFIISGVFQQVQPTLRLVNLQQNKITSVGVQNLIQLTKAAKNAYFERIDLKQNQVPEKLLLLLENELRLLRVRSGSKIQARTDFQNPIPNQTMKMLEPNLALAKKVFSEAELNFMTPNLLNMQASTLEGPMMHQMNEIRARNGVGEQKIELPYQAPHRFVEKLNDTFAAIETSFENNAEKVKKRIGFQEQYNIDQNQPIGKQEITRYAEPQQVQMPQIAQQEYNERQRGYDTFDEIRNEFDAQAEILKTQVKAQTTYATQNHEYIPVQQLLDKYSAPMPKQQPIQQQQQTLQPKNDNTFYIPPSDYIPPIKPMQFKDQFNTAIAQQHVQAQQAPQQYEQVIQQQQGQPNLLQQIRNARQERYAELQQEEVIKEQTYVPPVKLQVEPQVIVNKTNKHKDMELSELQSPQITKINHLNATKKVVKEVKNEEQNKQSFEIYKTEQFKQQVLDKQQKMKPTQNDKLSKLEQQVENSIIVENIVAKSSFKNQKAINKPIPQQPVQQPIQIPKQHTQVAQNNKPVAKYQQQQQIETDQLDPQSLVISNHDSIQIPSLSQIINQNQRNQPKNETVDETISIPKIDYKNQQQQHITQPVQQQQQNNKKSIDQMMDSLRKFGQEPEKTEEQPESQHKTNIFKLKEIEKSLQKSSVDSDDLLDILKLFGPVKLKSTNKNEIQQEIADNVHELQNQVTELNNQVQNMQEAEELFVEGYEQLKTVFKQKGIEVQERDTIQEEVLDLLVNLIAFVK